jgi:hypothetical protein
MPGAFIAIRAIGKSCAAPSRRMDIFRCRGFAVRSNNSSSAADFAASRTWSRHHLFAPTIKLVKDRAIAETPVIIRVRQKFGIVEADLTSFSRFLDRLERRADGWRMAERAAIYERDRLDPVEPSPAFDALFAAADTAHYPEQYRYMAFRLRMPRAARSRLSSIATAGRKRPIFTRAMQDGSVAARRKRQAGFLRGSPWQSIPMSRRRI